MNETNYLNRSAWANCTDYINLFALKMAKLHGVLAILSAIGLNLPSKRDSSRQAGQFSQNAAQVNYCKLLSSKA